MSDQTPAMPDTIFDVLHAHRSVRAYKSDAVERTTIRRIVEAGQRASTSSNLQMTTAVVVEDPNRREELARLCGDQDHIRQAPVFIAWCADRYRLDEACAAQGYSQSTEYLEAFLVAAIDVAIFMQNAVVAAESMGLGTCYIGGIRNDTGSVIELLELPRRVFPVAGMTLGWPRKKTSGTAPRPPKPRLETSALLHWDRYNRDVTGELHRYDRVMAETGIYAGRHVSPSNGNPPAGSIAGEEYGWMEHSARRVASPKRLDLREVLARQGFELR